MGSKRKRPARNISSSKRTRIGSTRTGLFEYSITNHPVLKHYFQDVLTLREHLVSQLSSANSSHAEDIAEFGKTINSKSSAQSSNITALLDTTIVGFNNVTNKSTLQERRAQELAVFTQQLPSSTLGSDADPAGSLLVEAVYFVIWLLFRRYQAPAKPQHLLCQGFERMSGAVAQNGIKENAIAGIPGIVYQYPNNHVQNLTSSTWCSLLSLLGRGGDLIMADLLVEACLFIPAVDGSKGLSQLSGTPLTMIPTIATKISTEEPDFKAGNDLKRNTRSVDDPSVRKTSDIRMVRNRMYYAKPSFTAKGNVKLGMHPIHVLNRCRNLDDVSETVHVMKYIFPRQFRLHNVFTWARDHRETALLFKDYNLREAEIKSRSSRVDVANTELREKGGDRKPVLPKRLRGVAFELVQSLRKLHHKCSYVELLRHHCPVSTQSSDLSSIKISSTDLATPVSCVSAFCQAVFKKVISRGFWGAGEFGDRNENVILQSVDKFLRARKYETFTLEEILKPIKISTISWLAPAQRENSKMSLSDFNKRRELLAELVYYLFDSFLVPLVRSNFHVTESGAHRNRLFYFRQDVWRKISEPAMAELKAGIFEELETEKVLQKLASRSFGFSHVRLLPKAVGFRPITNLRRRPYIWQNGKRLLGRSVNSAIAPAFRVLNYEKSNRLIELGCSLFSVGDIYPNLKEYVARQDGAGSAGKPLYLAKVDVQACFDTVPQEHLLEVITALLSSDEYHIESHAEIKLPQVIAQRHNTVSTKAVIKFHAHARPANQRNGQGKERLGHNEPTDRGNVIAVGPLGNQSHRKHTIAELLREHVEYNIIKIGKKYYRQKNGIPQGSVLSSLLCNFFYGSLEKDVLKFTAREDTTLIRLIDDFLLVTKEQEVAVKFLELMHQGIPEYGISVKSEKSLVNFECHVNGQQVPRCRGEEFPYCGLLLDTQTLDIKKNATTKINTSVSDSLTVEHASIPGRTFRRKALKFVNQSSYTFKIIFVCGPANAIPSALKIQLHGMYFDTLFNSLDTVLENLHASFKDAALRCFHYMKSLSLENQPSFETLKNTIEDLIKLAFTMITRKRNRSRPPQDSYDCAVRKNQTTWLACKAFNDVFQPKQTRHRRLLDWLDHALTVAWPNSHPESAALLRVVTAKSS